MIESNKLDAFLEEEKRIFSKVVQENAYRYIQLNKIKATNNDSFMYLSYSYKKILDIHSSINLTIKKCLNLDGIYLSEEEKTTIDKEIRHKVFISYYDALDIADIERMFELSFQDKNININTPSYIAKFIINKYFEDNLSEYTSFNKLEIFPTKASPRLRQLIDIEQAIYYTIQYHYESIEILFDIKNGTNKSNDIILDKNTKDILKKEISEISEGNISDDKIKLIINDKRYLFTFQEVFDYNQNID